MQVTIDYNTELFEFTIKCDDSKGLINLEQVIRDNQTKRITDWIKVFVEKINEETNNDPFVLKIIGCDLYEVDYIKQVVNNENTITLEFEKVVDDGEIKKRHQAIDDFIIYVENSKNEIVVNSLRPNIKNIKKHRATKIEVPVIATMSSGKSTLLNALIGQDLLHEDTGATTATTCDIVVNNKLKNFVGKAIWGNKEVKSTDSNIAEFLKVWNAKANENIDETSKIKKYSDLKLTIEGAIPNFNTSDFNLSFIDTPGPNSSQHNHHKEKTYTYLKDNQNLPIVLYVLDPEKMDSNDDDSTLDEIAKVFKGNNKNIDRVIFVYNKIDREDIEEKSIKDILNKVQVFLNKKGILNAKIFPLSAQYAKLAQIEDSLTNKKKTELRGYRDNFIHNIDDTYRGYELLDNSPLTKSQKDKLRVNIKNSALDGDLVYSGLAALKLYIEDYIINYHKKYQYRELYNIVDKISKQIIAITFLEEESLKENSKSQKKEKRENKIRQINQLTERKSEVITDLLKMNVDQQFIKESLNQVNIKFNVLKNDFFQRNELSRSEAVSLIHEVNKTIKNTEISIKTDLISEMNNHLKDYLERLKKTTKDKLLFNVDSIAVSAFNAEMENTINTININHVNNFQEEREETRTKEVESYWWFKRMFNITDTVEYKVTKQIIKSEELYKEAIYPYSKRFEDIIEGYSSEFNEKFAFVRDNFIYKLNCEFNKSKHNIFKEHAFSLSKDNIIKSEKIKELRDLSRDINKFKRI